MRFKVEGMTCKNCKAHVENSVKDLDGVENAVADLDSGELAISGSITDKQTIIEAVAKAGYSAKEE
jgi:copper chaperone CopZ